jgi:hypothetical protein
MFGEKTEPSIEPIREPRIVSASDILKPSGTEPEPSGTFKGMETKGGQVLIQKTEQIEPQIEKLKLDTPQKIEPKLKLDLKILPIEQKQETIQKEEQKQKQTQPQLIPLKLDLPQKLEIPLKQKEEQKQKEDIITPQPIKITIPLPQPQPQPQPQPLKIEEKQLEIIRQEVFKIPTPKFEFPKMTKVSIPQFPSFERKTIKQTKEKEVEEYKPSVFALSFDIVGKSEKYFVRPIPKGGKRK